MLGISLITSSLRLSLMLLLITNTLPGPSASEVTTLWRYTNIFIIIIIIIASAAMDLWACLKLSAQTNESVGLCSW